MKKNKFLWFFLLPVAFAVFLLFFERNSLTAVALVILSVSVVWTMSVVYQARKKENLLVDRLYRDEDIKNPVAGRVDLSKDCAHAFVSLVSERGNVYDVYLKDPDRIIDAV